MRIMVLSHGHPELGAGGAERAAYALFQRLKSDPTVDKAVFVARAEDAAIGHSAFFGSFRGRHDEILAALPPVDGFTYQSLNHDLLRQLVDELVRAFRPTVVHIHHFLYWGVEIFELFKEAGVRVVFTVHEYAAICAHYGQMIKADGRLCYAESTAECSLCFPSVSAGKFFVRKTICQHFLDHVDAFIAPSRFLKDRYTAWGLPAARIEVVENVLDGDVLGRISVASLETRQASARGERRGARRTVFGYFGQITPFKGVDVLLEACSLLPEEVRGRIEIRVHGENKHYQEHNFWKKVERLRASTRGIVRMMGAYRNLDVADLMLACDWIVVPSIWWENSPIVIQEARLTGRPIICSNIGGMAEKIDPRVDLTFPVGSSGALAELMQALATGEIEPDGRVAANLASARPVADADNYARHCRIYRGLNRAEGGATMAHAG